MKKIYILLVGLVLALSTSCNDEEFLSKEPTDLLLPEQIWSSKVLITNVLSDLYDRIPNYQHFQNIDAYGDLNEALISRNGTYGRFSNNDFGYGSWFMWDYGYVRDLNLFLESLETEAVISSQLTNDDLEKFAAEAKFLRAFLYFNMVIRDGGVPLILEPLEYDFNGDPAYLQYPRAKEYEIYDFVINELEGIIDYLPGDINEKSRATKGAAYALISRAALYAGSIAKHGTSTPSVSLPGEEVGIPASMADDYYEKSLEASEAVMDLGYQLYVDAIDENDPIESRINNFSQLFLDKSGNSEVIFVEDFLLKHKFQGFTVENQPFSMTEESFGSRMNPSLNMVEEFELLDNTFEPLKIEESGDYIHYSTAREIFANRDARLEGTIIVPGSTFKGNKLDIWGGYIVPDDSIITATDFVTLKKLPGKADPEVVVGGDGPIPGRENTAQTGFLIRKYLDPIDGAGSLGTQSEVWWIHFRYGEILLNASEALFELGRSDEAVDYMNLLRRRAGFTTDLTSADLTFDRIVHERKVELAFESHLLWDMKRWRLAHEVWDGNSMDVQDLETGLGEADNRMTQVFALIPYKYYDPNHPDNPPAAGLENHIDWVFKITKPNPVTGNDLFRLGNYYSQIPDGHIASNPKLVRNPNQ
ncbi:RagB/SusD family nutrient uptake outer membrane protein [Fulvivirga ligni]|uniref:RagB/SusD family nutrient uptake outer membrane protein n=1 Tax=Fulvivirga ligni TaxID=2904246 RepID=UPI001F1DDFB1|nr:RagB/SusD family nutrient uptake outer membrane protein [Fulvivirga ligni]UII21457.1 RagB/SusD family nutrient uptake outer membrane protein [Fulvivirga ligni]